MTAALRERGFEVTDSQANFVWAAHPTLDGGELAARLARAGVLVAAGDALGEPRHVRIALAIAPPPIACWTRSTKLLCRPSALGDVARRSTWS